MPSIHPTAIIDPTARIAPGATIGPYCVVGPEVEIGAGTALLHHVVVERLTRMGRDNQVHPFAVIGADPQDRKWKGERTTLAIGDRNVIREHVTIHRGTANAGGETVLGDDNLIMVGAHIAHDCRLGSHLTLANQVLLAGHVHIEDGATVSGGVGVHHYATIGTCSFVGGLARIAKDVPPYMIVEGHPAEVRGHNPIGMKRRGYPEAEVEAIRDCFKRLFRENGESAPTMAAKIARLREDYPGSLPVRRLCEALENAARGVHGRARELHRNDDKHALRLPSLAEMEIELGSPKE